MKLLLTNLYGEMGGGEFALFNHAKWLKSNKIDTTVCLFNQGYLASKLKANAISTVIYPTSLKVGPKRFFLKCLQIMPHLIKLLLSEKPNAVICYTIQELPFFMWAGMLCSIPIIYRDQGTVLDASSNSDWRETKLPKWLKEHLTGAICTTKLKASNLIKRGVPKHKVQTVYLGVDEKKFDNAINLRQRLISQLNIPSCSKIIGIFGRLIEWKGQRVGIQALSRIQMNNVHLLIVGGYQLNQRKGETYLKHLKSVAKSNGVEDQVHFLGFREDIPELMKSCDIICHTSFREPFGIVIIEAMMAGRPVVASNVSGPREIVVEGETGFLVTPGDPNELAYKLHILLNNQEICNNMGFKGQQRAKKYFSSQKNLLKLNESINNFMKSFK